MPALSTAQARDVITRYSKINSEANANRNRRLLDTVEDGPLYAMSVSDYTETVGSHFACPFLIDGVLCPAQRTRR
ncbi:hypothetical protein [Streptomyces sp. NBC_01483]|uniref:hypothetical protein n=1 Tax=Streptomyces sp. NBC_01483 TaxID=2903883 RepID=UPI002E328910|nr:hypothetical protein [Streptomyces sp. NBC_01483]